MLIFAYGSNMNINRLRERVPSASKLTIAYLKGYNLFCNKISNDGSAKANITNSDNESDKVWGVLFVIDDNEKTNLDKVEGLGKGYNEMQLTFHDLKDQEYQAQVYVADENYINNELKPYDWYYEYILSGARQNQLPEDYITAIQALKFEVDADEVRRNKHFAIINTNA